MWLSNQLKPGITYATINRALVRYCHAPRLGPWKAALQNLRYVGGTSRLGSIFQSGDSLQFTIFEDTDYATKATNRRSLSGGVGICGRSAVNWFCRTQKSVTTSTMEGKYVAKEDAVKLTIFMWCVWRLVMPKGCMPCTKILDDDQGSISSSKHIGVRHHFVM